MAASVACNRKAMVAHKSLSVRAPAHLVARPVITARTNAVPFELIAAAGDVEAPIAVPLVAALVVTAAVTFAVPAFLNRGQQAADKIFAAKEGKPLDKKAPAGKKTAAKTTSKKTTAKR